MARIFLIRICHGFRRSARFLIGKFQTKSFSLENFRQKNLISPTEGVWILKDTRMFFNVLTLRFPSKGAGIVNWLILLFVCVFEGPYSGERCSPLSFFGDSKK